ncbi:hypothetical protein ACFWXK_14125 [Streptomyces sp. NPDC059070]|uniref:hypothetical protein n=1 Tax=Streptomyces sp. NPDC059070 TaxID=3346713 RepID=UPI00367F94A1
MPYLPTLRRTCMGALVIDRTLAAHEQARALADLYREDPEGVGDMLIEIADLSDQAERQRDLCGLGHAEHVRDDLVEELLDELGGARLCLHPHDAHHALMQARSLARQAQQNANISHQYAEELTALTAVARGVREERRRSTDS